MPEAIANRPVLPYGLDWLSDVVFEDLSTCRPLGMALPGPIPWTAFNDWAKREEVADELFDYLWAMIRAMDDAFLEYAAKKARSG